MPSNPPVMLGLSNIKALNTSDSANVTIASVTPRVRIAGRATSSTHRGGGDDTDREGDQERYVEAAG